MPARLRLADHLTEDALFARFQSAADPRARSHWQVLWMVCQDFPTEDIAVAVGFSPVWIRKLVGRYNLEGPAAMGDRRHQNPGAKPLLSAEDEVALKEALHSPPPEGEVWSGPVVARWMSRRLGREVSRFRGREVLVRLGYTPQRPRPSHALGDPEAQAAFPGGTPRDARPGAADAPGGGGRALGGG